MNILKLRSYVLVLSTVFLGSLTIALAGGCSMVAPASVPVSEKLSPVAQTVQKSLNEANIAIAAAANVVTQYVSDGILTKPEAQKYVAELKGYAAQVDRAQKMLDSGDVLGAKNQAELLNRLVVALHKEVASRSRK